MPVGQVKSLELRDDGVLVTVDLTVPVKIREGYTVKAESTSLLGGMHLVIDAGEGAIVESSLDKPLAGLPPENVMESANELISDVRKSLNEGGILTNLEVIVSDFRIVSANLRSGQGTLGHLLSDDNSFYRLEKTFQRSHNDSMQFNTLIASSSVILSSSNISKSFDLRSVDIPTSIKTIPEEGVYDYFEINSDNPEIVSVKQRNSEYYNNIEEITKTVNLINKMIVGTPINEINEKLEYDVKPIIGQL